MKKQPGKKKAWTAPQIILIAVNSKTAPFIYEHSYVPVGGGKSASPHGHVTPTTVVQHYLS